MNSYERKRFQQITNARIGLVRYGHAVSTKDYLSLRYAHIKAVEAIYKPWHYLLLKKKLLADEEKVIIVKSQVSSKRKYLQRPDLGRLLRAKSISLLKTYRKQKSYDIVFIVSDGLSTTAIDLHLYTLWQVIKIALLPLELDIAPLVLAPFSRVAISDEIGFCLNAKIAIIIVGERPGSSVADSIGMYLTYQPKPGNVDAQRNCISNIQEPYGLRYADAGIHLCKLLQASLRQKLSGIALCLTGLNHI